MTQRAPETESLCACADSCAKDVEIARLQSLLMMSYPDHMAEIEKLLARVSELETAQKSMHALASIACQQKAEP